MSNERDELAKVIAGTRLRAGTRRPQSLLEQADAILAAGYRKPQQVTTTEELDALPTESVVRSRGEIVWEKFSDEDGLAYWKTPGSKAPAAGLYISLPATVLHEAAK